MPKQSERLDILLVQRGEVSSRERAKRLIMAGDISVDGQIVDKPGRQVSIDAQITLQKPDIPYVSRGGLKLERALDFFDIDVTGKNCIDVGASTGGFTDCLLQNGAALVYAVDVGYGQIDWKLRNDKRVVLLERTNIRYVKPEQFKDELELATIDVSFISLKSVLPVVNALLEPQSQIIALIKPQFEAGKGNVGKGGVVRESEIHRDVINDIWSLALDMVLHVNGLTYSPIKGPAGNIEYLIWFQKCLDIKPVDHEKTIESVVQEAHNQL